MSTFAIVISLLLLMFLAYRGITVLLLAPLLAAFAVLLSGDIAYMLPIYTDTFMGALGRFVISYLPIFLLGSLFGQLIADSGAANTIAKFIVSKLGKDHAILTVMLSCAVLTYGGVSLFVVAFAIYPIAKSLFKQADIPKRLIPATIALGSFTFTMTAMPGTPAIQNAIPIKYFGTNAFAAPILGLIASAIMAGLGMLWLLSRAKAAKLAGEGYGIHNSADELHDDKWSDDGEVNMHGDTKRTLPLSLAILPLILVIGINALLVYKIFPNIEFQYLIEKYTSLNIASSKGIWALIISLVISCLATIIIGINKWENLRETVNKGVFGFMLPLFNTASEVGYGAVIASLAGFAIIRDSVLNLSPTNPLISEAVAMNILSGITGSSSGGLSIALGALGKDYMEMAIATGISPELMHRVAVMAAGGFDTLPHCGAIITLLSICGLNHRQSYANIAVVTMGIPLIALITVITLGTIFGAF